MDFNELNKEEMVRFFNEIEEVRRKFNLSPQDSLNLEFNDFVNDIQDISVRYTHESRIAVEFYVCQGGNSMHFSTVIDVENGFRKMHSSEHGLLGICPLCSQHNVYQDCYALDKGNPQNEESIQKLFDFLVEKIKNSPDEIRYAEEDEETKYDEDEGIKPEIFDKFYIQYSNSIWVKNEEKFTHLIKVLERKIDNFENSDSENKSEYTFQEGQIEAYKDCIRLLEGLKED